MLLLLPNKTKRPVKVGSLTRLTAVVVVARVRTAHGILKHRIRRASANITRTARQRCGRPQVPGAGAGNNGTLWKIFISVQVLGASGQ